MTWVRVGNNDPCRSVAIPLNRRTASSWVGRVPLLCPHSGNVWSKINWKSENRVGERTSARTLYNNILSPGLVWQYEPEDEVIQVNINKTTTGRRSRSSSQPTKHPRATRIEWDYLAEAVQAPSTPPFSFDGHDTTKERQGRHQQQPEQQQPQHEDIYPESCQCFKSVA